MAAGLTYHLLLTTCLLATRYSQVATRCIRAVPIKAVPIKTASNHQPTDAPDSRGHPVTLRGQPPNHQLTHSTHATTRTCERTPTRTRLVPSLALSRSANPSKHQPTPDSPCHDEDTRASTRTRTQRVLSDQGGRPNANTHSTHAVTTRTCDHTSSHPTHVNARVIAISTAEQASTQAPDSCRRDQASRASTSSRTQLVLSRSGQSSKAPTHASDSLSRR